VLQHFPGSTPRPVKSIKNGVNDMTLGKLVVVVAVAATSLSAHAQVAGAQPLSVTVEQSNALLNGWSVKKSILGKPVYNDQNEKIGTVLDLVVAPDGSVSAAIVGAGGFLGVASHDVAVPIAALDIRGGNFYLAGATKAALKATPEFQYSKVQAPPKPKKLTGQ
jgi:PRC-barrel domain